ncbi:SIR2 family protein [Aeromonas rivipollensis]|uniref:P-loop NTPase n=1 Tax=Aeromonas rivipollensis TaxID=948519 RepID=UPI00259E2717|nr:SIR2 family protein [Aeromonas rivipollensis]MDM5057301.1 SIR2 family protein [Aeromonas rivipollensis]
MNIESQSTFERCLREGINIFTGAGFSLLAKDKKGRTLPVGDEFRKELLIEFPNAPKALQLPQLCTFLLRSKKDDLETYIRSRFDVGEYNEKYNNIGLINPKFIFTTNVDNLLESVFNGNSNKYLNDASLNGVSLQDKAAIDYIHLHGNVSNNETPLIFGDLDIASAFSKDPNRWNYFRSLMNRHPTLFWGYALRDAGTLQALADAIDDNNKKNSWIIVHPDYTTDDEIQYYKSLDLKIIKSDTESFLEYLGKFEPTNGSVTGEYKNPFPEYSIPSNSDIKHRAIQDFYQGATPNWSDIYSPRVAKLRHYNSIEEHANRGRNVLITGGPATGKTTLLMQFAAFHNFNGLKILHSNISPQKAKIIATRLSDTPTLLFVDNLQSSIDALNYLSTKKNIQLIIAERDYAYLSASSANFLRRNIEIIDITSLDEKDSQTIVTNIPEDIKSRKTYKPQDGDSLFELIERNCRTPSIKDRFNNVIDDLRKKDDNLVQLFLLACYLHTCRSVTSMDVLYSFFDKGYNDHTQLYTLLSILSSSVSEYAGEFAENEQDYFAIRSSLLADHIATIAPSKDMAMMLTVFHSNVPRFCVPNFDSFKRRAYDARIYERAFPIIEDGEKVYDIIYRKHQSPFNLQQKSLYLSRRGEHQRAFKVIDEAISTGGSRNWSIKNSYAIIKFKANIDRADCTDVRKALDESMEALEQCHSADVRKAFHAMSYTDQSLKYWKKYRDEKAISYLEKSKAWLSEEADEDNRIGNVLRLLKQVNMTLSSTR